MSVFSCWPNYLFNQKIRKHFFVFGELAVGVNNGLAAPFFGFGLRWGFFHIEFLLDLVIQPEFHKKYLR